MGNRKFRENANFLADIIYDREVTQLDNDWVTGRYDPDTGELIEDPRLGAVPGHMWVHAANARGAAVQVLIGDRMWALSGSAGKRVVTGRNHLNQAVAYAPYMAEDSAAAVQQAITATVLNLPAAAANLTGGRVFEDDAGGYGLGVWVEKLEALGWAGGRMAVDAGDLPVGTNEYQWMVVYFPDGESTPNYAPTVPRMVANKVLLPAADAFNLGLPAGAIRTQAFTTYTGQTDILNSNTRWLEMRRMFQPEYVMTVSNVLTDDDGNALSDDDGNLLIGD